MNDFLRNKPYTGIVQAAIFDWAGTTVDYGCFAPLAVFIEIFRKRGINITIDEAREPMGMMKRDHVRALCHMERIAQEWKKNFGKMPGESEISALYADFEPMLFSILPQYSLPIPGVIETVKKMRNQGIKIGSTTGYTGQMMEIVCKEAEKHGYSPDSLVTSTDVPAGRPYPWMCYANAIKLQVYPLESIVKVGDTLSDVKEGLNAGMWTVGVLFGSSEVGFSLEDYQKASPEEKDERARRAADRYRETGAHYVVDEIGNIPDIIDDINHRLGKGEQPLEISYR